MDSPWISATAHPAEQFECLDCSLVSTLDPHGRCARCGSNAVLQLQLLEKTGQWAIRPEAAYWVPAQRQYWALSGPEHSVRELNSEPAVGGKKNVLEFPVRIPSEECA